MTNPIRYGVLSTANIARNHHIPAAHYAENSEIIAISSRNQTKAKDYAAQLGIPKAYGSYDDVLADPDIDAIINPLPNSLHCEWTIKAAEAGKHILCEKPLAVTVDEAKRMITAAKVNGVLLMEGFTQHFLPHLDYARQVMDSGDIGEVLEVRAELAYTMSDWENDTRIQPNLAGGALLDAGCYCVNTIRSLMRAEPIAVQAFQRVRPGSAVNTTFMGVMRFPGDKLAFMETSMEQPFRGRCEIVGTQGRIEIPTLFEGDKVVIACGDETHTQIFIPGRRFALQMAHFSDAILNGTLLKLPPEDALANTKVLVALQRAAEMGQVIKVSN